MNFICLFVVLLSTYIPCDTGFTHFSQINLRNGREHKTHFVSNLSMKNGQGLLKHVLSQSRKLFTTTSIVASSFIPTRTFPSRQDIAESNQVKYLNENSRILDGGSLRVSGGVSFVRDAVRNVGPSVVRIDCEREIPAIMGMFSDTFREGDTIKVGGSGIIVSSDGYILTNAHVVDQAKKVTISLSSGRAYKCKVISSDELTDLAVLKADIGSESLPKAPLGDSSVLHSGDWVIAVGNPAGLDFTVTLGIVSNPKRTASEVGAPHMKGIFIQTDAALNQGNSGGPLVNEFGDVIGINTMVRTNTEAIGFAIPINQARRIYEILKEGKKPTHAYFGVEVMSLTPDIARIHNDDPNAQRLPEIKGALVLRVIPGSPAATCGIRKNDIIVNINGHESSSADAAEEILDVCHPGQNTKLKVIRGEGANVVELDVVPQNLLSMIEEKKRKMQPIIVMPQPGMKQ